MRQRMNHSLKEDYLVCDIYLMTYQYLMGYLMSKYIPHWTFDCNHNDISNVLIQLTF